MVDADACPKNVLEICMSLGRKYAIEVWTVANFHHNISSDNHVLVGGDSQEADIKLANLTNANDIVVTQDWGLAAIILGKRAFCLSPGGKEFREETIDFLLEEREAKAKVRRGGGRTKGPSKRTGDDDRRFAAALERLLCSQVLLGPG